MPDISIPELLTSAADSYQCYTAKTVNNAPKEVGLYAWYSMPSIGKPDWLEDRRGGVDLGRKRFQTLLNRHTNRHKQPDSSAVVKGAFDQQLQGKLEDVSYSTLAEWPDDPGQSRPDQAVYDTLQNPKMREAMVDILMTCAPLLTAPIYIGVAKSLNDRLGNHVNGLREKQELLNSAESEEKGLSSGKMSDFAARAISMGFSVEHLFVITLTARTNDTLGDVNSLRIVAESVEWMLNRWNRPLLGRS